MAVYLGSNRVSFKGGTFNTDGTSINNQNKTVTPTTSQQTITADSGYTGLGTVTINRIPTNYIIPSGTLSVTSNGTKDVTSYASINVNVPTGSSIINQDKTIEPSESEQYITADSGYTGLGMVTVEAISSTYVGSNITRQAAKTVTPTTSSQTAVGSGIYTTGAITVAAIPSSYIIPSGNKEITSNGTNIDVSSYATVSVAVSGGGTTINNQNKTVTPSTSQQSVTYDSGYTGLGTVTVNAMPTGTTTSPTSISGTSATVSTGTNTLTLTKTISVTPRVTTAGYVSAGTAGNSSVSLTASVTTKAAATITPGTSNQTIASGTYLTGTQTISGDANLVAGNIKSGTSIFGVTGTYEGSGGGGGGDTEGVQIGTKSATRTSTTTLQFTGLSGQPTSFSIISDDDIATNNTPQVAAVSYDGTTCHGQTITNTNNAQVSYTSTTLTQNYSNGTLTITASGAEFPNVLYNLTYSYNGSSSDVRTADVQVGSGATSITFTGLSGEPSYFSCIFKSNFNTSSGYQRVIAVANNGSSTYGLEMDSSAHAATHWSYTYNNGSLTINSQSTNVGGYFHQPGYYQLTYVTGRSSSSEQIEVESITITNNGTYTAPAGKAYSPVIVSVSSGGMNIQAYHGMAYARATTMTATDVTLTVNTTGTYKISWMGFRNTTSGTSGSQLYINGTAYGNSNTTFTSNYGQSIVLTGVSLSKNDVLVVRAQARSTSYYMYVGNLIIEQTA